MQKKTVITRLTLILMLLGATKSKGEVYPEHRDITVLAIQKLSPEYRSLLDKIWLEASKPYPQRLTPSVIVPEQGIKPTRLDYGAWPAISGDHSTSPENLIDNVLKSDWILKVADIAAQLKLDIALSKNNVQHNNAIRHSDIRFQRADPEYATRAGSNNVHFMLALPRIETNAMEYFTACISKGAELNAIGAYSWFHYCALMKAARYAKEELNPGERSSLALALLADEAFGIHFLEDAFASGHTAGTWGSAAVRKGTHDYYNEKGLEIFTWDKQTMVVMGDAYMRPKDLDVVSATVLLSLEQLLNAANGSLKLDYEADPVSLTNKPDTFDVSKYNYMPDRIFDDKLLLNTLIKCPVPGLATGLGELPRFRSEMGVFLGASAAMSGSTVFGGFGKEQTTAGANGGIEANIRLGLGMDGVLNQAGDGLVFVQFGWKQDGASSNTFSSAAYPGSSSSLTSAIPARSAYNFRLRMPFWLIPGDLMIAGPLLMLFAPKTATKMAVVAGNGGLIPWQSGISTPIGRFQFILGREIGVSLYGRGKIQDVIFIPVLNSQTTVISYRSTQLDFPFLEYSPFKTFATDQSTSLLIQMTGGVDIPQCSAVKLPANDPVPALKSVWYLGMRVVFNWRKYL